MDIIEDQPTVSAFRTAVPFRSTVPFGWETAGSAIAWIAFRTAVLTSWWDFVFYFGASRWDNDHPGMIVDELTWLAQEPARLKTGESDIVARLRYYLKIHDETSAARVALIKRCEHSHERAAAAMAKAEECRTPEALAEARAALDEADALDDELDRQRRTDTPEGLAEAARELAAEMTARLPELVEMREKIWAASEELRRALAADKLAAFGWPGERKPEWKDEPWPACRERVPPALLRAPVTLTQDGVVPFPRDHDHADSYRLLFCDILIDAEELLAIWPAPASAEAAPRIPAGERRPIPVEPSSALGGRPRKHDWDAFWCEVARWTEGNDLLPEHRAELQRHMERWTAETWREPPDSATIRARLKRLYSPRA